MGMVSAEHAGEVEIEFWCWYILVMVIWRKVLDLLIHMILVFIRKTLEVKNSVKKSKT